MLLQMVLIPCLIGRGLGHRIDPSIRWFFGVVAAGVAVSLGHAFRVPEFGTYLLVLLAAAASFAHGLRGGGGIALFGLRIHRWALATLTLMAVPLAAVVLGVLRNPLPFGDGMGLWFARVAAFSSWQPISTFSSLRTYPDLGSILWMLPLKWVGLANENIGRLLLPCAYAAWIASWLRFWNDSPPSPWTCASALHCMLLVFDEPAFTNGYQDCLVFMDAAFTCSILSRLLDDRIDRPPDERKVLLATAGFLNGALSLIKQEGNVWSMMIAACFLACLAAGLRGARAKPLRREALAFAIPWLAVGMIWPLALKFNGIELVIQQSLFSTQSILHAPEALGRWPLISGYFYREFYAHAGILWLAGIVSLGAAALTDGRVRMFAFLWTVVVLHYASLAIIFFATRADVAWHLRTAFERLAWQGDFALELIAFIGLSAMGDWALDRRRLMLLAGQMETAKSESDGSAKPG